MLMDLQQKVDDVPVSVGHSFQPFDLVVDPLGDGRGDSPDKEVQYVVPLAEQAFLGRT